MNHFKSDDRGAKIISTLLEDITDPVIAEEREIRRSSTILFKLSRWFCIEKMQDCQNLIDSGGLSHMDASYERT